VVAGVVDVVEAALRRLFVMQRPQEPQFLLVADVGQTPHERREDRRGLGVQVGGRESGESACNVRRRASSSAAPIRTASPLV
jgi:hypothetical protein